MADRDATNWGNEKLLERLRRANASVETEYVENDRRLTWMLVFQAFLFQAYATALQGIMGTPKVGEDQHARFFLFLVIVVGVVSAIVTCIGVTAGHVAIRQRKQLNDRIEREGMNEGLESSSYPIDHPLHGFGLFPSLTLPSLIAFVWIAIGCHAFGHGVLKTLYS